MSVEDDLENYARRIEASISEEHEASDDEARTRARNMRKVLLMNAEGLIARSPQALKIKAKMVWGEDCVQNPTSSEIGFIRSLLRDLIQWEP